MAISVPEPGCGVNEALVDSLAKQYASLPIDDKKGLLIMSSQLIGVLAASTQGDADAKSLQTGAWVAGNATQHNYLSHWQEEKKRAGGRWLQGQTIAKPE